MAARPSGPRRSLWILLVAGRTQTWRSLRQAARGGSPVDYRIPCMAATILQTDISRLL